MTKDCSRIPGTYSVLIQRTVLFWERVDVEARTPEEAAELAHEEEGAYDWSNGHESEVSVTVESGGKILAELAYDN